MSKGKKDSFFKKSMNVAHKGFKSIFKEIIQNAKNNADDVDMRILEPNLKEIIKEVSEELSKDRAERRAKLSEVKGIITSNWSALKEAIKSDKRNGLDDETKEAWIDELDDFDIDGFLDDFDFEDDGDDFSEENDKSERRIELEDMISVEDAQKAFDAVSLILCSSVGKFKTFLEERNSDIASILSYKTLNEVDMPISVAPNDSTEIDLRLTRSMELVKEHIGLEDDIYVEEDEIEEDETIKINENVAEVDEVENKDILSQIPLLTKEATETLAKFCDDTIEEVSRVKKFYERLTKEQAVIIEYSISLLIEIFELYQKTYPDEEVDKYGMIDFLNDNVKFFNEEDDVIVDEYFGDNLFKLTLIIGLILNYPVF